MSVDVGQAAVELFSTSPALFVENQGQWAESVRFVHQGDGVNVAMTDAGPTFEIFRSEDVVDPDAASQEEPLFDDPLGSDDYVTYSTQFSAKFLDANAVTPTGRDQSTTRFNYLLGAEENWRTDMPGYEAVAYENLYDSIDLLTWGQRDSLKYEFHVAPGADYRQIQVSYVGIEGLSLDTDGTLRVALGEGWGELIDDAPYIYQVIDGQEIDVPGRFTLVDDYSYTFEITGDFDPGRELVVDPDLAWSTYLGGSGRERGKFNHVAVDTAGNVLVTGGTNSTDFQSAENTIHGSRDAFAAKLSPAGDHVWMTYIGGNGEDYGRSIAVDTAGNALVTGTTLSTDFLAAGNANYGLDNAFVVKLSPTGYELWRTCIAGSSRDYGQGIAIDATGNALVSVSTHSTDIQGAGNTNHGGYDAIVVKLSPTGYHLWSTYIGGSSSDFANDIAVDTAGNALVTGRTPSTNFEDVGNAYHGGSYDAFVAKLSPTGSQLWSTYVGGSSDDRGWSVGLDSSDNVLVTGETNSSDWASEGYNGGWDAFAAKLSPNGTHLWKMYLGGGNDDHGRGVAVDSSGNVLVTGYTGSLDWTIGGYDTTYNGGNYDAFAVKLNPNREHIWSTYLGGSSDDWGCGIAVDPSSNVLVAGETTSSGWTEGGWDTTFNGGVDVFVAKIVEPNEPPVITAGNAIATVNEGETAYNTGTFADVDVNDIVTITASIGTITQDTGNSGNWWWSFDTTDGPDESQSITITGDDGVSDPPVSITFDLVINNVAPTAADATFYLAENSPYGRSIGFVTATDPGDDTRTYSITGGNELNAFAIDATTGEITVKDSTQLDFETITEFDLMVTVTDTDDVPNLSDTANITINLLNQASITGTVFVDTNQNGLFEADEMGINGVIIELLDEFGDAVLDGTGQPISATTSDDGFYLFEDLEQGIYQLHEVQPSGVEDGAEQLGSLGGMIPPGTNDIMQLTLDRVDASDYIFAEIGQQVASGDTATIGFWQNKHGQSLIQQGGPELAQWLTENFKNVFGDEFVATKDVNGDPPTFEGGAVIAAFYKDQLFKQKAKNSSGPAKVDAQFMAVALATYFTSDYLAGDVAEAYGFNVTATGIGAKIVNVGTKGAAFGVADDTDLTVLQLLWATDSLTDTPDSQSGFAYIYDTDGDGVIDADETQLRSMANDIYSSINEQGDI